eukprot:Em0001g2290a
MESIGLKTSQRNSTYSSHSTSLSCPSPSTRLQHHGRIDSFPKDTGFGPSGLRIQHLIEAAEVPLQFPICAVLREVVNLLISGKVPVQVARFLAGGNLVALEKNKHNCPPDIRPIAVGEAIRRLAGKCLCSMTKAKAHDFLAPFQLGVACQGGAEKIIHGLRSCVDKHWHEVDFAVLKIDLHNAFNQVSRQAVLNACALHIPELLPSSSKKADHHLASISTLPNFVAQKQSEASKLLKELEAVGSIDPQVALLLLRQSYNNIASFLSSGLSPSSGRYISSSLHLYNSLVDPQDSITHESVGDSPLSQKGSSFVHFFPHASAWLSVTPSPRLNLHLEPAEFQVALKWWLGIPVVQGQSCPHCPSCVLDDFGHHSLTCKHGGDVVSQHNKLRDVFYDFCQRACLGPRLEMGCGAGSDSQSHPADVLVPNWDLGKPAAFDLSVTSTLQSSALLEASVMAGSAALAVS